MTAIVAVAHGGKVIMGCDSAGTRDWDLRVRAAGDCKIIKFSMMQGAVLVGVSGIARWLSLLKDKFEIPAMTFDPRKATDRESRAYVAAVVDAMHALAKEHDLIGDDKAIDAGMLIGFGGMVWIVDSQFGLIEHAPGYAAIGCGDQVALGALYVTATQSEYTPHRMVTEALEAAEAFSAGVRGPFVVMEA